LRSQSLTLSRCIDEIRAAAPAALEDAINLMDLTSRAADLFAVQPVHEKQGFLRLILKSATWRQGQLQTEFQQPFENLRRSNQLSSTKHKENGATDAEIEIWLPFVGSYRIFVNSPAVNCTELFATAATL
jgi:acetyl/propionyl-CoA carboxylase alpha subunit